jgi:3-hydroxyisobutyrate dehydrogenase
MGGAMAARLLDCGFSVQVHDIDAGRQRALVQQGAHGHDSPAALALASDVIMIVVVDAGQIMQVLRGVHGLLSVLSSHHVVMFCSTIGPSDMIQACKAVVATGASAIDAPISGGPQRAREGVMSMMLAADPAQLARLKLLLDRMAARCFEISSQHGDASKAKLVNNLVAGINLAAAAEGLALARELGMDERQMLALMSASSGQSWIGDDRLRRALDDDYEPRAQTHVLTKDLTLATGLAREHGYPVPLGEQALALFRAACQAGHRDEDDAALLKYRRNWR